MSTHILFVGRQPDIYAPLWRQLLLSNTQVSFAASQARALRELDSAAADVIVLDAASLRLSPEPLARTLRQRAPAARMVLIADSDVSIGYSYDYLLASPAAWTRVLKVIEEALASERRQVLVQGPFVLDLVERTIIGPAGEARLTGKLFGLLALLMRNAGRTISRHQIMQEIWHTSYLEDTRTLDVHMSWLRGLVEPEPKKPVYLRTKRGVGYIFTPTGAADSLPAPLNGEVLSAANNI
ncbi:MAG TPA: response regulator transcription factor [Anaerolineae bacterium]|nr:response regulator transcription factor [Anaerolineae bacterium]